MRTALAASFFAALALPSAYAAPVRADTGPAVAEQLFLEGQRLLAAGRVHEACEKLAASQRLDPALGTLINLGLCHEREGKTASAWSEYADAAAQAARAGQGARERFAREHAAALEPRVAKLAVTLEGAPAGARVELDGAVLPDAALSGPIPVDPGEHTLRVTAEGKREWTESGIAAVEGAVVPVRVTLEDAPADGARPASPRRTAGWIAVAVGGAAVAAGAVFLVRASAFDAKSRDEADKANLFVPADPTFKAASLSDHDAARTSQVVGFVAGGVGLAAVAAGLVLAFTGREAPPPSPASAVRAVPFIGARSAGLGLQGAF